MAIETFRQSVDLPVAADKAFRWHERPGAIDRLLPPWEPVTVIERSEGIHDGQRVVFANRLGPLQLRWVAEHRDYHPGLSFQDVQLSGPFRRWHHTHRFVDRGPSRSTLEDHIEYEIPAGALGQLIGSRFIRGKIERMFRYRHDTTTTDLAAHDRFHGRGTLRLAISGSSGLLGSALTPFLTTGGHTVLRLVRDGSAGPNIPWSLLDSPQKLADALDGVDAVVHLAGENIAARRWTRAQKRRLWDSRVLRTEHLVKALVLMRRPPRTLISASAVGVYGDQGSRLVHEGAVLGEGFLADLARAWESATLAAQDAGVRVVNARFGMIMTPRGGALAKMLPPFSMGFGGRVGSGEQWWSWISLDDAVGALHHLLMDESVHGPVNCTAPNAVTNKEFTRTLAGVLKRPALLPAPRFAMRWALGAMSDELLMSSIRAVPDRLQECRYPFRHPTLLAALQHLLGRA